MVIKLTELEQIELKKQLNFVENIVKLIGDSYLIVGFEKVKNANENQKEALDKFKDRLLKLNVDAYYEKLSRYFYALKKEDLFEITANAKAVHEVSEVDKLECLKRFLESYRNCIAYLKKANIIDDNLNPTIAVKPRNVKEFEQVTDEISQTFFDIDRLMERLKLASNREEWYESLEEIDKKIKEMNSTNQRLAKLGKKDGNISAHQRSLKLEAVKLAQFRNQSIVDDEFDAEKFNAKASELKKAYDVLNEATTANKSAAEIKAATKRLKKAERAIYGHRLTAKRREEIEEAKAERQEALQELNKFDASEFALYSKRYVKADFIDAMKRLKKIDQRIVGKHNAKEIYAGLRSKAGLLIGGTGLTLPKQVVELEETITLKK